MVTPLVPDWLPHVLRWAYVAVALLLLVYGANYLVMWALSLRARKQIAGRDRAQATPFVTVQVPVYNERYVLARALAAIQSLDWPRDRLEIQVLDDSTDDTTRLAAALVERARAAGFAAAHVRRASREGFKAGALNEGLRSARGEYVAIFDADFVAPRDFLRRVMPVFGDARVACAQTRWRHLNEDASWLTRAIALGLDAHFMVEQRARSERGFILSFNGTGCVWRRAALDALGGWPEDTLAEDLDLSCRALLAGWRFVFQEEPACPAEIPDELHAFERQQFRWAKGSMQNLRRHGRAVLASARLSWGAKAETLLHFTHYAIHPLMLLLFLLQVALALVGGAPPAGLPVAVVGLATVGPLLGFARSQRLLHPGDWPRRLVRLAPLTLLGIGICLRNSRAILQGLFARERGEFERTPKSGVAGRERAGRGATYARVAPLRSYAGEAALAVAGVGGGAAAWSAGHVSLLPGLVLFTLAFSTVVAQAALDARAARRRGGR